MDVTQIIDPLNEAQRNAVTLEPKNALVLAGAGSGKTRVLVHRIAWVIGVFGYSPFEVMAVTFTNKAAKEMRERTEQLLNYPIRGMWMGTFHGIALRMLRDNAEAAGLPHNFQILDSDDQQRYIKRLIKTLNIDDSKWPAKQTQWFINQQKDEMRRAGDIGSTNDPLLKKKIEIYAAYDESCRRAGLVDFAEILLRTYELLKNNPQVLRKYQHKFKTILVDEFQDTNTLQYEWLKLLTGENGQLFLVGDDDQSIYGWRGAKVENLHSFTKDFDHEMVRLEQNYRSTGNILKAANKLIDYNPDRLGKNLWTEAGDGDLISLYSAVNEIDEAKFICQQIQRWLTDGNRRSEIAVLYRSNAQSRVIEENLVQLGINYRVYGGLRFFDRAEIKDALAYLRLIVNQSDDAAFERVINTPARGIGEKTVATLRRHANTHRMTLWRAAKDAQQTNILTARALKSVTQFVELIETMGEAINQQPLAEQFDIVLRKSTLLQHYESSTTEQAQTKLENLQELVSAAQNFQISAEAEENLLNDFLAHAVLENGGEQNDDGQEDCVQLMSLHSAKGLEFPLVFLCGMEEGLFPHTMSYDEPGRLEEERRLCYVGITRAKKKLYLTHAERRRLHGRESYNRLSQFVQQMPQELIEEVSVHTGLSQPRPKPSKPAFIKDTSSAWQLGQRVAHTKFGEGIITNLEGSGPSTRIQVNFTDAGSKWLVASFARLETV